MSNTPILFCTSPYHLFTQAMTRLMRGERGEIEQQTFPDGEVYQRLITDVHERAVIIVGGTIDDRSTLALYDLACAVVKYGAKRLDICIPYFGYSTMERAVKPGEIVTAKTRARLLSSIPYASQGNHFHFFDLHSEGLPHYFEGAMTTQQLNSTALWVRCLQQINQGNFVIASTDTGRAKQVERFANALNVDVAFIIKRRISGEATEIVGVNAPVDGRVVVIYDDMVRTGGSLLNAAQAYKEAGATEIYAVCSHGVFPGESWNRLKQSGYFKHIIATNSHPRSVELAHQGLEVLEVSSLFAEALNKVFSLN